MIPQTIIIMILIAFMLPFFFDVSYYYLHVLSWWMNMDYIKYLLQYHRFFFVSYVTQTSWECPRRLTHWEGSMSSLQGNTERHFSFSLKDKVTKLNCEKHLDNWENFQSVTVWSDQFTQPEGISKSGTPAKSSTAFINTSYHIEHVQLWYIWRLYTNQTD